MFEDLLKAFNSTMIKAFAAKTKEDREKYFYQAYGHIILMKVLLDKGDK